jgi:hypothetical protein
MAHCCLTDIAGPFYDPNKPFRNWSSLPFYQIDSPHPPYVDQAHLANGIARACTYLEHVSRHGYTGIVIDNLAHLVGFEHTPVTIYPWNSPYRQRAAHYRQAFGTLFDRAKQLGMQIFVTADMQWSTPPIKRYVKSLAVGNPRLQHINRWALAEAFTLLPQIDGIIVRVGETGGSHDQGTDYTGHMLYTTVESMHWLIDTLLPICQTYDKLLIVRTWSIGIGEIGDMMWSSERYNELFGPYHSPHLMVSLKHTPSDFYRHLPRNPTLGLPGPQQIIELQNRREYELFGMVPSAVVPLHQELLQHEHATNPQFHGIWAWNSSGGWGGGRAALASEGWSIWTELSSALTAALFHTPDLNTQDFIHTWCIEQFGEPFGTAVAEVYQESARFMEHGWYPGRLAHRKESLGALYLPPLLWVWWMHPTASLIVWAYLASAVPDITTVLHQSNQVRQRLEWHRDRLAPLAPPDNPHAAAVVESIRYFADTIRVAHTIREFLLPAFDAVWRKDRQQWNNITRTSTTLMHMLNEHQATWQAHPDLPPLELDEINAFLNTIQRRPAQVWFEARAACGLVSWLRTRQTPGPRMRTMGVVVAMLLLLSFFPGRQRRAALAGAIVSVMAASPVASSIWQRTVRSMLPLLSRQFYLLPSIFFETGPSFTEWA